MLKQRSRYRKKLNFSRSWLSLFKLSSVISHLWISQQTDVWKVIDPSKWSRRTCKELFFIKVWERVFRPTFVIFLHLFSTEWSHQKTDTYSVKSKLRKFNEFIRFLPTLIRPLSEISWQLCTINKLILERFSTNQILGSGSLRLWAFLNFRWVRSPHHLWYLDIYSKVIHSTRKIVYSQNLSLRDFKELLRLSPIISKVWSVMFSHLFTNQSNHLIKVTDSWKVRPIDCKELSFPRSLQKFFRPSFVVFVRLWGYK